ncbi:MAG TPA: hypothetical protein VMS09_08905 [Paenibacillus sp.]|uniref:hypothetical protein n=1 Tax=Paenibacillus sp. TaxID=58172 RepID=UPI0028D5666A|nr:hypothetical protein [Paenibacillus sp.]HUC92132.1 hypothetical protein [Paenibacillus sp.]
MDEIIRRDDEAAPESPQAVKPGNTAKVVAEMPDDNEMRSNLQQQKENDGYPGSCGI